MKTVLLFAVAALVTGCGTNPPAATTPIPTDTFTAVGHYRHQAGSIQIATEAAERFCKHWGARPGILESDTVDLREGETVGDAATKSAGRLISTGNPFDRGQYIKTTLKYRCY